MGDDDSKLQDVARSQLDMLLACGYTKPIIRLTHKDVPGIIDPPCNVRSHAPKNLFLFCVKTVN